LQAKMRVPRGLRRRGGWNPIVSTISPETECLASGLLLLHHEAMLDVGLDEGLANGAKTVP